MRPFFIQSKAERNAAETIEDLDLYPLYSEKMKGMYEWGIPSEVVGVPEGYIEECAFTHRGFGLVESKSQGWLIAPATSNIFTPYGIPAVWTPQFPNGAVPNDLKDKVYTPFWQTYAPCELIRPFVEGMARALNSLKQNLVILGQPVIIETPQASAKNGDVLETYIMAGDLIIPTIKKDLINASVLDLKGEDHTQNLINTYRMLDSEALTVLGISNPGSEKTSGITSEETLSGTQECTLAVMKGLDLRRRWCAQIEKETKLHFTVNLGKGYQLTQQETEKEEGSDGNDML